MYFVSFIAKNLLRRPARTVLTVLGLAVSVAAIVALLGISHNVEAAVAEAFERRGIDLVIIEAGKPNQLGSELDEAVVDRVRRVPGVDGVAAAMIELMDVKRGESVINALVQGWPTDNFSYDDLKLTAGRKLTGADRGKALLGRNVADNLRKGVGDTVELAGEPFEVVGVYESFSVYENGSVTVLLSELQRLAGREGKVTGFSVRVAKSADNPQADVDAVRGRINALTDDAGKPLRLSAQPTRDYVASAGHIQLTKAMAWMVSAVAVLIGVISMLNTMVMSVLERTQEIGILRAVGWPPGRVVRMVLGEAVLLGLAAAVVGTLGAAVALQVLVLSPTVSGFIEPHIAPAVAARGVGITLLIGLVGGAYPAVRAARLLPTEAIRHD